MKRVYDRVRWQMGLLMQQGVKTYIEGVKQRAYYTRLQNRFQFESWHLTPYQLRPYAWNLVRYINRLQGIESVLEIGCGIGDIIRNINSAKKYAFDISISAINCARYIDSKENGGTQFFVGSFDDAVSIVPQHVDLLVTVNFIHNISDERLKFFYRNIIDSLDTKNIVADMVRIQDGHFSHDFKQILPDYEIEEIIWESCERKLLHLIRREENSV